ncbi:hypothetical protein ACFVUS_12425 [Nocardia sp. NPDC058058]|uniref:hypothetical protein n=1 Tax=Nocardia sp. NPDC058058 TaxID=3346317 RepID=UPI0036DD94A4
MAAGFFFGIACGVAKADGDTQYFNIGGFNCSITGAGVVGCDVNPAASVMYVSLSGPQGQQFPVPYVPAVIIDNGSWPAHPEWSGGNAHTLPGGNPALPFSGDNFTPARIDYAGATCTQGYRGAVQCTSMGHQFNFNSGQVSGS